jgi:hypothetical protein
LLHNLKEMEILNKTLLLKLIKHLLYSITARDSKASNTELSQFVSIYMSLDMEQQIKNASFAWEDGVARIE